MGYSLSYEEAEKRKRYVEKVHVLSDRYKKFGLEYLTGDRSEVYKPMIVFPEYIKDSVIYLYYRVGIRKAKKVVEQLEDNIISRVDVKNFLIVNGVNRISEMNK